MNASMSQEIPKISSSPPVVRRGTWHRFLHHSFGKEPTSLTPRSWTAGFQTWEATYFSSVTQYAVRAIRTNLVLSCFTLQCFADTACFTQWRLCGTRVRQVYRHRFPSSIGSLCVSVTFWQFSQYFKLLHYYFCCGELGSVIFDVAIIIALGCHNHTLENGKCNQ